MSAATPDKLTDRAVLLVISIGLILIIGGIILGIFMAPRGVKVAELPNWAENVLVSIGTAAILKLGDCLAALVQLSTGKSVERLGNQLGQSQPISDTPQPVTVENTPEDPVQTTEAKP